MNKRGQSLIEYALIVILVILGIVIAGPYALRSIDAHFKLWDEGVQDSFTENLSQAPDIINIASNCVCSPVPGLCGDPSNGTFCGAGQREWDFDCNTQGCNGAAGNSFCVNDTTCCTYVNGPCGTYPCPPGGCAGASITPPSSDNCYYGQRVMVNNCPYLNLPVECATDGTCPLPQCMGILSPGALYLETCSNNPPSAAGLLQNYDNAYVGNCSDPCTPSTNANPCAVCCDTANGYMLNQWGTSCLKTFEVAPNCASGGTPPGCNCYVQSVNGSTTVMADDCSFEMCAGTAATILTDPIEDISAGSTTCSPGCCNPGNPGEQCEISVTF